MITATPYPESTNGSFWDRWNRREHPFLENTAGPLLATNVPLSDIGTGKLLKRWQAGEKLLNRDLVAVLLQKRISQLKIDRPFVQWLRAKRSTRVQLQNGRSILIPPLNTDNNLAGLKRLPLHTPSSTPSTIVERSRQGIVVSPTGGSSTDAPSGSSTPSPSPWPMTGFDYSNTSFSQEIYSPQNQYKCGSCWALSTATAISDSFVVSGLTKTNPYLSYTYALSCYPFCVADNMDACMKSKPDASMQCSGGNFASLCTWVQDNGLATSRCVDYEWCRQRT